MELRNLLVHFGQTTWVLCISSLFYFQICCAFFCVKYVVKAFLSYKSSWISAIGSDGIWKLDMEGKLTRFNHSADTVLLKLSKLVVCWFSLGGCNRGSSLVLHFWLHQTTISSQISWLFSHRIFIPGPFCLIWKGISCPKPWNAARHSYDSNILFLFLIL